mgnify:CR=1 FL=1
MSEDDPVAATERWLRDVVVGLDLCPFAAGPLHRGGVRIVASRADDLAGLLAEVQHEATVLMQQGAETTLLVVPELELEFEDLLDVVEIGEALLEDLGWQAAVQLVGFHPDYVFGDGLGPDDPANATNRSPYPTLHLLRADDVERAIAGHPDIASIPKRNVALLRARAEKGDAQGAED